MAYQNQQEGSKRSTGGIGKASVPQGIHQLCFKLKNWEPEEYVKYREHKKIVDSKRWGAAAEDIYVPRVWYYNSLLFLSYQTEPRTTLSTLLSTSAEAILFLWHSQHNN